MNFLKQKKLIFNFFVNCNWKKLTDSRKRAKILADNRKNHHPIETLIQTAALNYGRRTFLFSGAKIFDELPLDIANAESVQTDFLP